MIGNCINCAAVSPKMKGDRECVDCGDRIPEHRESVDSKKMQCLNPRVNCGARDGTCCANPQLRKEINCGNTERPGKESVDMPVKQGVSCILCRGDVFWDEDAGSYICKECGYDGKSELSGDTKLKLTKLDDMPNKNPKNAETKGKTVKFREYADVDTMHNHIVATCDEIKKMLLEKNEAYGNAAAEPVRIFSKADPLEQINVRIDDKLSRMMKGKEYPGDDTELDLIGYLILKRAIKRRSKQ